MCPESIDRRHESDMIPELTPIGCVHSPVTDPKKMLRGGVAATCGVFGLRANRRPNPIALSLVELQRVEGSTLYVEGLDAVDGTPVLDIKS